MGKMILFYDYTKAKLYCETMGLVWLGDEALIEADHAAYFANFTQPQVDVAMRQHIKQVNFLFTPGNYRYRDRLLLALYFLTGWRPKPKT